MYMDMSHAYVWHYSFTCVSWLIRACCNVLYCVAVCCSVLQCDAVCCRVLQCAAVWLFHRCIMTHSFQSEWVTWRNDTLRFTVMHCNTLQRSDTLWSTATFFNKFYHAVSCYNALWHTERTATHCNTLQLTATQCRALRHSATHCITLQHTATYCNTL